MSNERLREIKKQKNLKLYAIVAHDFYNYIGKDNIIPWKLKSDLQRFKRLTMGRNLIVGRKTYESIGKPLPGRKMIVVSSKGGKYTESVCFVKTLEDALERCPNNEVVWVIGGGQIYEQLLPYCDVCHQTIVFTSIDGDVRFPNFPEYWKDAYCEYFPATANETISSEYNVLINLKELDIFDGRYDAKSNSYKELD